MIRTIILSFCLAVLTATATQAADIVSDGIARPTDVELTCTELTREVNHLGNIISGARDQQDDAAITNTGVGVVKTVGAYAIGTMAGALGILAAAKLVDRATDSGSERAEAQEDAAEQRQSRLAAIFETKGCEGDLVLASETRAMKREVEPQDIEPAAGATPPPAAKRQRFND